MHPAVARLNRILTEAVSRLESAGARDEALARYFPAQKRGLVTRKAKMVPVGRVWRLGTLLLDSERNLYATAEITVAGDPKWPGHQSLLAERRREYRAAAQRAKFPEGESLNHGWAAIDTDIAALTTATGPLFFDGEVFRVRWSPTLGDGAATELEAYLADRIGLLVQPPIGS